MKRAAIARVTGAVVQGLVLGALVYAAVLHLMSLGANIPVFRYQGF